MADYTIYTLAESHLTISGGAQLDGVTQGDGSHLQGETITLNSNSWETVDISDDGSDTNFADSDASQTLNGAQTIFGTTYASGTVVEAEYTLTVQDPDGNSYTLIGFNVRNSSPAYGTVEGLAFIGTFPPIGVPLTVVSTAEGPSNSGGGSTPAGTYATPPCFAGGTLIDTVSGPRPIEHLQPGDRIITANGGAEPLSLTLATQLTAQNFAEAPNHRPILIRKDAISPGVPDQDMIVSPQHRILLDDWRASILFGADQVLAAARHLVNGKTVKVLTPPNGVVYHHLVFETHQVVSAQNLLSESFYPGEEAMAGLNLRLRYQLLDRFPVLTAGPAAYGPSARPGLKRFEARLLAA